MIFPKNLSKGDRIGIIATARKISLSELAPCIQLLESWGLLVEFAPNLFCVENQFAGSDEMRSADLQWAIDHPELKAVIVARGGYGTSRMIDLVDFSSLKKYPKWFIGFSDVTVLLSNLFNENIASLHADVALLLAKEGHEESTTALKDFLLEGKAPTIEANWHSLSKTGSATATIIGGNLSILHTILATDSDLDYAGKILFIEDLDEYLYHIDRMVVHLDRARKLKNLAGLVVGHMSDMKDNAIPFGKNAEEIIARVASKYDFPIAFGIPIGHEARNFPVVNGAKYSLEVTEKGSFLNLIQEV